MPENIHASYFGQSLPHILPEGNGEQPGTDREQPRAVGRNGLSQTLPTVTIDGQVGQQTQIEQQLTSPPSGTSGRQDMHRQFRVDLVTEMDGLVQDFRERKTSKVENLYQILQIIRQADISLSVRRTALGQYTTHIDLIDGQQQLAEHQEDRATRTRVRATRTRVDGDGKGTRVKGDGHRRSHTVEPRQENRAISSGTSKGPRRKTETAHLTLQTRMKDQLQSEEKESQKEESISVPASIVRS
jgi:hypothetical protein